MRTFDTVRLHLRPLGENDESLYCRLYADPLVMRHIGASMSPDAARRSFRTALRQQGDKRHLWIITERSAGVDRGMLGVTPEGDAAEVGVMLFTEGQGRGLAAELLSAIIPALFGDLAVERLWTRHANANRPARSLMSDLGFEPIGAAGNSVGEQRWQIRRGSRAAEQTAMAAAETSG